MDDSNIIVWDKKYEVGVGSIDTEHRVLFMGFNTFVRARSQSVGSASVGYALSFLEEYMSYHFRNEERLMSQVGYDRFELHRSEHRVLMRGLASVKEKLLQGHEIDDDIFLLFRGWILEHVVEDDRDIGTFLRCKTRFYAQQSEHPQDSVQEPIQEGFTERRASGHCISNKDGRVYKRYAVNMAGTVTDHQGNAFEVMVQNLSQGGARLLSDGKMFKEGVGALSLPTTQLPILPFLVLDVKGRVTSVCFTLSPDTQMLLTKELMSPEFISSQRTEPSSHGELDKEEWDNEIDGSNQDGLDGLVSFADL